MPSLKGARRLALFFFLLSMASALSAGINRRALLERNNPHVNSFDSLASLTVGNGGFAMTVDATGLQTFPAHYSKGVPLGTQSDWGWHSFPNPQGFKPEEVLKAFDFGHGSAEALYSCQFSGSGRQHDAAEWYRVNPHRLHLGVVGFELPDVITMADFTDIYQELLLRSGIVVSNYRLQGNPVTVRTVSDPVRDLVSAQIRSVQPIPLHIQFPYPTGAHADDGCDWNADSRHSSDIVSIRPGMVVIRHKIDDTVYFVAFGWQGEAMVTRKGSNSYVITPQTGNFSFSCEFLPNFRHDFQGTYHLPDFRTVAEASAQHWADYWNEGGMVDFSDCTDPRASELERRVVLSQYLMAVNCAGDTPPQETGLTYNSWYGKFHLEMLWWHQAHFALWGHPQILDHTLQWFEKAEPMARQIAERQGFDGVRWMKMTDPSATEAPSNVGSFLIWQQPHLIHLAELLYRANPSDAILQKYYHLIYQTAEFMRSFATYDEEHERYVLQGVIPAQETLKAAETVNPPLELSAWCYGLRTAQQWLGRMGMRRVPAWDDVVRDLSPLATNEDDLYLAAETAPSSFSDERFLTDHPAVLGAIGMYPPSRVAREEPMRATLKKVWHSWKWDTSWGWDFPLTAMCAARVGEPVLAVDALLKPVPKNTYLPDGHNWQSDRLRVYLPGNGGLLTAVAMMCAGWDGAPSTPNPGFPDDGTWNVHWEGLLPLP